MAPIKPLVLDVDGTFLRTDMLFECFWAGLGRNPGAVLSACIAHWRDPAALKRQLAGIAPLRTDLLPVSPELLDLAKSSVEAGREVVLASASDEQLVKRLAADHGLSERVFASDGVVNLKGRAKAQALVAAYGEKGFDYAGNEPVDRDIWDHAENALVVGDLPRVTGAMTRAGQNVAEYPGGWKARDLVRALRPHQWVKNVLLLVPMLAAHNFALATLLHVLIGMAAFSMAASSIYVVNDLLDLEADRLHPTKFRRPFASGAVPIRIGMWASGVMGLGALVLGLWLGAPFFWIVMLYMALSLAYSLRLKRLRWIDIATLASLYTIRVVAGAAAGAVYVSGFLLVWIFPVFIALGGVKRLTELTLATSDERLPGRGYGRPDRGDLLNVAILGVVGALLTFFLYTFTEQARTLYPLRWLLWVAMLPMAAWLIRMVWLGYTGKQDYDPIVFAMKDLRGLGLIMLTLSLMFYAAGIWQLLFGL
ncbi:UbiA family prenyltransferase [Frigidibacter sp. ROC022]|uniref:UbiA family prenyltransferase n=1 Tax=Frigidibacter sp. ROC022 TaxID=2971796 RepID=UPI00215A4144|nr:UbiA family prenyltransferase [Frigidibacter sp. ROC022]MCR8723660.1 UbiA family prenyltransferase [Frigidibacter sp. ROC022]